MPLRTETGQHHVEHRPALQASSGRIVVLGERRGKEVSQPGQNEIERALQNCASVFNKQLPIFANLFNADRTQSFMPGI
jgi:hypothetical protein